jgi:hypothetical protein
MLLRLSFCVEWFVSKIQKRIQNSFENGFGKLEKNKTKRDSPLFFGFWPVGLAARPHFPP